MKRQILNHHYVDGVNGKSNITKGKDLVKYLYDELYILKIGEKKGKSSQVTLSRSEYQLVLRTERDFVKLPVFALLFVAFEELTPLVCLLFPLLIPSTCVTPAAVRKLYHKRDEKIGGVKLLLGPYFQGKVREMSEEEAGRLYDFFKLGWMGKISSSNAIEKLEFYRKEILVDTQLILNNGGFELLNKQELLRSVYERGLKSGAEEKKTEEKNIEESIDEKCEARFVEKLNKWAKDTDFEI